VNGRSVRTVSPIGSTLQQRYQILEQLGRDGAVTTYLAIDLQLPGNLQLKCAIHRYQQLDTTEPDWKQAVESAQALYELSRRVERLPIVYSYFVEDRSFYVVREFVVGVPLAQELLGDRVWTQSQLVKLIRSIARSRKL
jgi:serine/threonine protein kinase